MNPTSRRRGVVLVPLVALVWGLSLSTSASTAAPKSRFFEETASAFWAVPHECADGSMVDATLLVQSTRDFESPDRDDPDPTVRVQYLAVCPDGTSFSWIAPATPAVITSKKNLKRVTASGSGTATDNIGGTHEVCFRVVWRGVGPLEKTVNGTGSITKEREAIATGRVSFDGDVLVNGRSNHPTRPPPFIRVDIER